MPELKEDWAAMKAKLRERFPGLTENELEATGGEREAVVALLELRVGYGHQSAELELDRLLHEETHAMPGNARSD